METVASVGLYIVYLLVVVGALAAIVSAVIDTSRNPNAAKKRLISIGSFALIIIISFLVASGDRADMYDDAGTLLTYMASAGLIAMYITGILAIGGLIVSIVMETITS